MGRDGAESASSEASSMDVDGVFDHLIRRNPLVFVFRMRLARVGQIKRGIQFFGCHGRIGRIDNSIFVADGLNEALGVHHVRLFFDVPEILGLFPLVSKTVFVAMEHDIMIADAIDNFVATGKIDDLGQFVK